MKNETNQLEIEEVFPHILQKGSCDRCKECKQEIAWLWMCPTWQTITVAFWSFLQFSIINVDVFRSTFAFYICSRGSTYHHAFITHCHCHSIQFARDKCHARERTRIFNMAEHWELNKRVDRNIDNNEFYLYKGWWKFCFMQWNSLWPSRRSTYLQGFDVLGISWCLHRIGSFCRFVWRDERFFMF